MPYAPTKMEATEIQYNIIQYNIVIFYNSHVLPIIKILIVFTANIYCHGLVTLFRFSLSCHNILLLSLLRDNFDFC
jgi:hypothetical protein